MNIYDTPLHNEEIVCIKIIGGLAQLLRALATLLGNLGSIPIAHTKCFTILCNSNSRGSNASGLNGHCTQ